MPSKERYETAAALLVTAGFTDEANWVSIDQIAEMRAHVFSMWCRVAARKVRNSEKVSIIIPKMTLSSTVTACGKSNSRGRYIPSTNQTTIQCRFFIIWRR